MLERERLDSKKKSKTNAVTSIMGHELPGGRRPRRPLRLRAVADRPQVGPHPARGQARSATCRSTVELKLEVWDSPNSAGIVIDAVRIIKLALNNGIAGQLDGPSSYLMKSPHTQRPDDEAREQTEEFIRGARAQARAASAPRELKAEA